MRNGRLRKESFNLQQRLMKIMGETPVDNGQTSRAICSARTSGSPCRVCAIPVIWRNFSWVIVRRISLKQIWRHNRVCHARFVFERNKHKSFGGARALTADDDSRNRDLLAVGCTGDFVGLPDAGQLVAYQAHGMWTRRQPLAAVIRLHPLNGIHRRQGRGRAGGFRMADRNRRAGFPQREDPVPLPRARPGDGRRELFKAPSRANARNSFFDMETRARKSAMARKGVMRTLSQQI